MVAFFLLMYINYTKEFCFSTSHMHILYFDQINTSCFYFPHSPFPSVFNSVQWVSLCHLHTHTCIHTHFTLSLTHTCMDVLTLTYTITLSSHIHICSHHPHIQISSNTLCRTVVFMKPHVSLAMSTYPGVQPLVVMEESSRGISCQAGGRHHALKQ
jgi:hypothetical protein